MLKVLEVLFCVLFLSLVAGGMFILSWIFITFFVMPFVHLFWPRFGVLQRPEMKGVKEEDAQVKRVAIDFVIAERIRVQRELKQRMEEMLRPKTLNLKTAFKKSVGTPETNWNLSEIEKALIPPPPKVHDFDRKDIWALAKFPSGTKPVWLCQKLSTRDQGLRCAFTAVRSHRLTFDLESAKRWATVIPDTIIVPASAAARVSLRSQMREEHHAQA